MSFNYEEITRAASGRWSAILTKLGLPGALLDGDGHPCPKAECGGEDRFSAFPDINDRGAVICRKCHNKKNDTGIATVMWWLDCSRRKALKQVAEIIGESEGNDELVTRDNVVEVVARTKRIPLESFIAFGAKPAKRDGQWVARLPVYNAEGNQHSHFDMFPSEKAKGKFKPGKGSSGLFRATAWPEAGEKCVLVEGGKDAPAIADLGVQAIGLPGSSLPASHKELFAGVHVVLMPDLDEAGMEGARKSAKLLEGIAASVSIATLPGDVVANRGEDVRDVLARPGGREMVLAAIESAVPYDPSNDAPVMDRPRIVITLDEGDVADQVILHLSPTQAHPDQARLYQRGGKLVHITCDPVLESRAITLPPNTPRIVAIGKATLRESISRSVVLVRLKEEDDGMQEVLTTPPQWLVAAIHERGEYPKEIPYLAGIVRSPTLRPDGTVVQDPGYDLATGLLYLPSIEYPRIGDAPTREEAIHCAGQLLELVADFPFVGLDHRSVWLSLVLTLAGRPAIEGCCPLFTFDASVAGSGKTLAASIAHMIVFGSEAARRAYPSDDSEMRKTITTLAREAINCCLFDNVATTIGSASLDSALTATTWSDRVLGTNDTTGELPLFIVLIATGNNLAFGADSRRRIVYCRLEPDCERPEQRSDFRITDLMAHAQRERAALLTAAVTILRAYIAAGRPDMDLLPCSFQQWSNLVRQAITWLGLPDPLATIEVMEEADHTAHKLELWHNALEEADPDGRGITSNELQERLREPIPPSGDRYLALRELSGEYQDRNSLAQSFGSALRARKGIVRSGKRIVAEKDRGGVQKWSLSKLA